MVTKILISVDVSKLVKTNKEVFIGWFAHIKAFVDSYYEYLANMDIDIAFAINKSSPMPQSLLRGK